MAIIITGCSTIGKSTLVNELINRFPELRLVASTVTREKRNGDVNYRFVSNDYFKFMIDNGYFMDSNRVFSDSWYGTLKVDYDAIVEIDAIPLIVTDMKGAKNFHNKIGKSSCVINLMPIDIPSTISRIIANRKDHVNERIQSLKWEIEHVPGFHNFRIRLVEDCLEEIIKLVGRKIRLKKNRNNEYLYGVYCFNNFDIHKNPWAVHNKKWKDKRDNWDLGYKDAVEETIEKEVFYNDKIRHMRLTQSDWFDFFKNIEEERLMER